MALAVEIRPLRPDDDRRNFTCGQPDLDRYFRYYAGQNQFRLRIAVTHVAWLDETIVGFATVAVGSIDRRDHPSVRRRKRLPAYPLPIVRLARLGVAEAARGRGVGRALVRHVLELAVRLRDEVGCIGVLTDAKPDAIVYYETLGFLPSGAVVSGSLHGEPTPMFLPMATIEAALGG